MSDRAWTICPECKREEYETTVSSGGSIRAERRTCIGGHRWWRLLERRDDGSWRVVRSTLAALVVSSLMLVGVDAVRPYSFVSACALWFTVGFVFKDYGTEKDTSGGCVNE